MTCSTPAPFMSSQPVNPPEARLTPGRRITPFTVESLSHGALALPDAGLVHLQFRRYAGCPICNFHLRDFRARHAELVKAGVKTVAFFQSTADEMRPFQGDLPFPSVPDPGHSWYARFGVVDRSKLAALHPSAAWAATKGMAAGKFKITLANPAFDVLPADVLLAPDGTVVGLKYGTHANDHWDVDDVLALARQHQRQRK